MTATTHASFNDSTEGLEVAQAFSQSIKGKTILVTGVNRQGIGFTTAQAFASQNPARLIVAGRSAAKLQESIAELAKEYPHVDYRPLILDLCSLDAVRKGAEELLSWDDVTSIDILVNNAGIMKAGEPDRELSPDGIEIHFATNHIGPFLFTNLIMPKILKAASGSTGRKGSTRIINVSSGAAEHGGIRWSDINFEKISKNLPETEQPSYRITQYWKYPDAPNMAYVPILAYVQSKAANILFGIALTDMLYDRYGVLALAVHPGTIMTEIGRYSTAEQLDAFAKRRQGGNMRFKTQTEGASTTLVAATDPKLGPSEPSGHGAYIKNCRLADADPRAQSRSEAEKLWKLSEELVKETFSY